MERMSTQNTDGQKMIEITLAAIIGILGGVAGTLFAINQDKETLPDKTSETQQEIIQQLTDLDLIKEICSPEQTKTKEQQRICLYRKFTIQQKSTIIVTDGQKPMDVMHE